MQEAGAAPAPRALLPQVQPSAALQSHPAPHRVQLLLQLSQQLAPLAAAAAARGQAARQQRRQLFPAVEQQRGKAVGAAAAQALGQGIKEGTLHRVHRPPHLCRLLLLLTGRQRFARCAGGGGRGRGAPARRHVRGSPRGRRPRLGRVEESQAALLALQQHLVHDPLVWMHTV